MRTAFPHTGGWTLILSIPVPFIASNKFGDCFYIEFWVVEIRMKWTIRWNYKFHKYDANKGCYIRNKLKCLDSLEIKWLLPSHSKNIPMANTPNNLAWTHANFT